MNAPWRFVLPSLLTCVSITSGFLSMAESVAGHYQSAAWFILLCVLLDKADGSCARLLDASTQFGLELDSLSDLLCFGVAPAVLVMTALTGADAPAGGLALLPGYREIVLASAALYVIGAALRLAKFNVKTDIYGKTHFFGIPTTLCGAFVAAYYLTMRKHGLPAASVQVLPVVLLALSLLMVSRVPLRKLGMRKSLAFNIFLVTNLVGVYACGLLRLFPEYLLVLGTSYLVIGSLWALAAGVKPPGLALASAPAPEAVDTETEAEEGPRTDAAVG